MAAHSHVRVVAHVLKHRAETATTSSSSTPTPATQSTGDRPVFAGPSTAVKVLVGVIVILCVFLIGLGAWKTHKWRKRKQIAAARARGIDEALGRSGHGDLYAVEDKPRRIVLNPGPAPPVESGARWVPQAKPWMVPVIQEPARVFTRESLSEKLVMSDPFAATPGGSQEGSKPNEVTIVGDSKSEDGQSQTISSPPPGITLTPPPAYKADSAPSTTTSRPTPPPPPPPPMIALPEVPPPTPPVSLKLKPVWDVETPSTPTRSEFPSPVRSSSFAYQQALHPATDVPPAAPSPVSAPPATDPSAGGRYPRAVAVVQTFAANLGDELVVHHGEPLVMLEDYADGWCLCQRASGEQGVVPRFCVAERAGPAPSPATPGHKRKSSRFRSLKPARRQ